MSVGYQGEKLPVDEEAVLGVDLVYSPFSQIRAADVEPHRESFYDYGSDFESLAFGTY